MPPTLQLAPFAGGDNPLAGSIIELNVINTDYTMNGFVNVPQNPGKSIGSGWNHRLARPRYMGFENPTMNIQGMIDFKSFSLNATNSDGTMNITGSMLRGLVSAGTIALYFDPVLLDTHPIGNGSAYVVPSTMNMSRNTQNEAEGSRGVYIDYGLELREVSTI